MADLSFPSANFQKAEGLCLIPYGAKILGVDMGQLRSASINIDAQLKDLKAGWPQVYIAPLFESYTAKATIVSQEAGTAIAVLGMIAASLGTGECPSGACSFNVFGPTDSINVSMDGYLLQEATLNLSSSELATVTVNVEGRVAPGDDPSTVVSITGGGTGAGSLSAEEDLKSVGGLILGIGDSGFSNAKSATLTISTQYKRIEAGYPKTLLAMYPMDHTVTLEVETMDLLASGGGGGSVSLSFSGHTLELPNAIRLPSGVNSSRGDWATTVHKFMSVPILGGNPTLLTIG